MGADETARSARPEGIRCMLLRGGTSKGAFFLASDVPADPAERDDLMLRLLGSPDPRQIDGLGGGHPLTSKAAIVSVSEDRDADLDYLFLQVGVDRATVGAAQTCGNLLAAVGPFAVERGLLPAGGDGMTTARIRLRNTGGAATATFATPAGIPDYDGDVAIDGVPGTAGAIELRLGAGAGPVLPTGLAAQELAGRRVTLVDNGMPVVLVDAASLGVSGDEDPGALEADARLCAAVEEIRREAGPLFGLGDVREQTVPKVVLLSPPRHGGTISTRAFIPFRVHASIGVLMAASVAAGIRIPGAVGHDLARLPAGPEHDIEHPAGVLRTRVDVSRGDDGVWRASSRSTRTARKIFDGIVFPRPRR
ncbi:MAG: 4-oxalomesaconate tautomerase [Microbacterium sp.]|jgi:4-oxalomesaconate tautomerase|uniref:PrpF domain-containing protein n=1 Tax=Microbacterium sp. TaxID=51671 RepID=UPI00282BDD05|nr:PrpF domain-containing protein [Microbacterium sp.]MDR2322771.1 4-oxalomesaconate tautomerase [Microbacterium sp.]